MAKKKEEKAEVSISSLKEFEKEFGAGVFKTANSIIERNRQVIPLSPRLNMALGGGITEGSLVIFSGPEKFGKTTLALHASAKGQDLYGKKVFYQDVERRLKTMNLKGIAGLNLDPEFFQVISSEKGNILSAEKHLSITEKLCNTEPGSIIIIDSSSALCSESEMINDITGQSRNLGPKLMANFCRKCGNVIAVNDITLIVIQHLINDTSGMGKGKQEDGGVKLQYQQDIKVRGLYKEMWKVGSGENETIIGQKLHWKVLTGALEGNTPSSEVMTYLRYGTGVDELMEYVELAEELSIIKKSGSWYNIDENTKFQGAEKLYNAISEDKALRDSIIGQVKEMAGI